MLPYVSGLETFKGLGVVSGYRQSVPQGSLVVQVDGGEGSSGDRSLDTGQHSPKLYLPSCLHHPSELLLGFQPGVLGDGWVVGDLGVGSWPHWHC